jgi:hypothetical protein
MTSQSKTPSTLADSDLGRWGISASEPLARLGVKFSGGGTHITRTMMLDEITRLLASVPIDADEAAYREAVEKQNTLGKATESSRTRTYRHLRELYGLNPNIPLFSLLRQLAQMDSRSMLLLALLVAWARDPQFRSTTAAILDARMDDEVSVADIEKVAAPILVQKYNSKSTHKIAKNASSSWAQSGHLFGRTKKTRRRVEARASALALALFLSHAGGLNGEAMFGSIWCRLLDLTSEQARSLAKQAHREELINLRIIGSVVEISFPRFEKCLEVAA